MGDEHDDHPQMPDLQEWVARYGGYHLIDWPAGDRAVAAFERERRAIVQSESDENKRRK